MNARLFSKNFLNHGTLREERKGPKVLSEENLASEPKFEKVADCSPIQSCVA